MFDDGAFIVNKKEPAGTTPLDLDLARLRSHELHMKYIYGLRWGGLFLAALTIVIGSVMVFKGLQGSFDWAFEAPRSVGAKMTNASPGIAFATIGLILGFMVVMQKPVSYNTGSRDYTNDNDDEIEGDDGMSIEMGRSPGARRRQLSEGDRKLIRESYGAHKS
jgi:hypothetical protein